MIDRKLEPLIKREMTKYLGELEDDDLVMFVLEHLKDHKGPHKLVEGLEPVRVLSIHRVLLTTPSCPTILADLDLALRSSRKRLPSSSSAYGGRSSSRAWPMAKACTRRR